MSRSTLALVVHHLRAKLACQERSEKSDEQLLHAFTTHRDDAAFAVLVHRHGPMVLHVCRRVLGREQDAEDAFQAIFLVLARKAAMLRRKSALASWLHGVAYRIALKAKQSAERRRKYEGRAQARSSVDPTDELLWREVRALLDEEIARLPEKYRSVFVLCCLEELSQAEAGRHLGLKEGTVANRLAQARKRLAQRLRCRGVELMAVLAVTGLAGQPASALSPMLIATTIEAALATAAGDKLASVVSTSVAELLESAMATMMVSKAKLVTLTLLTVTLLGSATVWAYRGLAANSLMSSTLSEEPSSAKVDDKPKVASPQRETAKTVKIQGRVFDPHGKPKAGARILVLHEDGNVQQLGVSMADGGFFVEPKEPKNSSWLLAQSDGFGIDFINLARDKPIKPVELRLMPDHAIRGRVVNTEGKPVHGVRVAIEDLFIYADNSLNSFLVAWKRRRFQSEIPELQSGSKHLWSKRGLLCATITDKEGRFNLHSVGVERFAKLRLSGAGIADAVVYVANREGFEPKLYNKAMLDNLQKDVERRGAVLQGPDLSVVAEAEKPIHGVVTDADSAKGCPNIVVWLTSWDENHSLAVAVKTTTDSEGRYEMHGTHKAKSYLLSVKDDPSTGYVRSQVRVEDTAGHAPITANIRVKKGVVIIGKLIDGATGKPITGFARTAILRDNPFAKEYPERNFYLQAEETAEDGTYRVVAIPGPIVLMGGSDTRWGGWVNEMTYKPAAPDPIYPRYFRRDRRSAQVWLYDGYGATYPLQGNFCKVLQIKPGATFVKQDIVLERASALPVKIEDAEGRPLRGVWTAGIGPKNYYPATQMEEACCSVYDLESHKPRLLVFYEPRRKFAGSLNLKGEEKTPVVVKLGPVGAITGRLLDGDGKPLAGAVVQLSYRDREAYEVHRIINDAKQAVTDKTGAFTFNELLPQLKFELTFRHGRQRFVREAKPAAADIEIKPGECRDLGAIKLEPVAEHQDE
jgi:RNA polymerase sigma factor (sigma-70 family)